MGPSQPPQIGWGMDSGQLKESFDFQTGMGPINSARAGVPRTGGDGLSLMDRGAGIMFDGGGDTLPLKRSRPSDWDGGDHASSRRRFNDVM